MDVVSLKATEQSSHTFTADLEDENGTAIEAGSLTSVKATLIDIDDSTRPTINSRLDQEVLSGVTGSTNELTVATGGKVKFEMKPADFPINDDSRSVERHKLILTFAYTSSSGAKTVRIPYLIVVQNLEKVT